jgi:hypothetical protein
MNNTCSSNRKIQPAINYVSILWYNSNIYLLYNYTITYIKLINDDWSLCQCPYLNSFRINVLVLSGILDRSFSMIINSCWIKISFSSNPESFQILADEIVNSSMVKSRDFTKKRLKIPKGQSEFVYRRIENTMAKRKKYKRINSDLQNIHIKLKFE